MSCRLHVRYNIIHHPSSIIHHPLLPIPLPSVRQTRHDGTGEAYSGVVRVGPEMASTPLTADIALGLVVSSLLKAHVLFSAARLCRQA